MTVLVLGATGNIGPHVIEGLIARGEAPRVLARDAARATELLPDGVDIRAGDPGDDEVIAAAADGVDSVFLLTPHDHDMTDLQLRIIRVLRRSGQRIIKLSGTSSAINPDGPFTLRQHWEVEQMLKASGQPHVIVRPNAFMQTLIGGIMFPQIQATGKLPNAIASSGISLIDARDIGEACATVLIDSSYYSQTLVLTGARPVTFGEIARMLSDLRGEEIETLEITPADVRRTLLERGMHEWEAEHFEEMYQMFRDGESEFVTDDAERILGRDLLTVERYVAENHGALSA